MGRDLHFQCPRTISSFEGSSAVSTKAPWPDCSPRFAWRTAAMGRPCALLLIESCIAHVDQGDGEGARTENLGQLCCARNDRFRREIRCGFRETHGGADADETEWKS